MKKHTLSTTPQSVTLLVALALCLLSAMTVSANGDPVAVHSAITLAHTPVAVHIPEVQLLDEHVTFVPDDRHTRVTVRYLLRNTSRKDFHQLPYGFPIDYYGSGASRWTPDGWTESIYEAGWRDDYVRNVVFELDGRQLTWQCSKDTVIRPKERYILEFEIDEEPDSAGFYSKKLEQKLLSKYGDDIYGYTLPISRRWFYTYLEIPAGKVVSLEVSYMLEHTYAEGLYHFHADYFENPQWDYFHDCNFQYDFTPAAYWGNGKASHFLAELDASAIDIMDTSGILKMHEYRKAVGIKGLPMTKRGNVWHYETQDFDLAAAEPFVLDFYPKRISQPVAQILNHRIPSNRFQIIVSGVDPKYPVKNAFDGDPATTMVLRPDANDSLYITIRFTDTTFTPQGILLLNGYCKNLTAWRNNSRIGSLMATARWDNMNYISTLYSDYGPNRKWAHRRCADQPRAFDWQSLADNAVVVGIPHEYSSHVTEVHFAIGSVEHGQKYDDLCISEILVIGGPWPEIKWDKDEK